MEVGCFAASGLPSCGLPLAVAHFIAEECIKVPQGVPLEKRAASGSHESCPVPKRPCVQPKLTGGVVASVPADFARVRLKRLGLNKA